MSDSADTGEVKFRTVVQPNGNEISVAYHGDAFDHMSDEEFVAKFHDAAAKAIAESAE